jgi:adenylate kinase family enzyme
MGRTLSAGRTLCHPLGVRLYIIGGPGSGKSSLADALSARTRTAVLHLDDHWDRLFARNKTGSPTADALAFREQLIGEQLQRDAWIIEGAEPPCLDALAVASDLIVWCDVPYRVAAFRMIRRHVIADLSRSNRFPGYRRLWLFVRSVRRRYDAPIDPQAPEWTKWTRAGVQQAAHKYSDKLIQSRGGNNSRELRAVIQAAERAERSTI